MRTACRDLGADAKGPLSDRREYCAHIATEDLLRAQPLSILHACTIVCSNLDSDLGESNLDSDARADVLRGVRGALGPVALSAEAVVDTRSASNLCAI